VLQSLWALSNTLSRFTEPIPCIMLEQECTQAISEVRQLFHRDDISCRNITALAEYALYHQLRGLTFGNINGVC